MHWLGFFSELKNKRLSICLMYIDKRRIIWILFMLLLFVSSYSREVIFRSVNAMIAGESEFYAKTTSIDFLTKYSAQELYRLKYYLTIGFTLVFVGLTSLGLKFSFVNSLPYLLSLGLYGVVVLLSGISIVIALLLGEFSSFYPFLRDMVGLIHNPLLFIILSIGQIAMSKYN